MDNRPKGPPPTRRGVPFDQAASALQKACRRGDEELAVRIAADLDQGGMGAYTWRRLFTIASEDVGPAEPLLPATLHALHQRWLEDRAQRRGDGAMFLIHAVLLIARAPKDRSACHATLWAYDEPEPPVIPDWALDRHTRDGRKRGRGWPHFWQESVLLADPDTGELRQPDDRYAERARQTTGR